ncbi:MAG: ROK family protein [Eubacteriales bacterium]|nr:ROK family protein [Eubacteriales bacterium]
MEKYIGVDLGGTNIKVSVFDETFRKLGERRAPTEVRFGSGHVLQRILDTVTGLLEELKLSEEQISCMGIGVPGILDIKNGISRFSPNFPKWAEVPIVAWMENHLHIPTYIDNDARVNLYGEWKFGAGQNRSNVLMITLGTGLGGAAVVDGRVIYGATGSAGEIGHINMFRQGRECRCGSSGCLGRYVSALGILRTFREKVQAGQSSVICDWVQGDLEQVTADMLSKAYDEGDPLAIETMRETGELLGYGLCAVFSLYNPEIIIFGGGMSNMGDRLLQYTKDVLDSHALRIPHSACTIVTAVLGDAAGMLGAAAYAKEQLG